ncbi:hypothetical protein BDZ91DRAFT_722264 [Kalaharituber pfeilii]|nr:hypothetical protein BDZ91DRAFT_722264 [Kalaharituber pfeilii]
MVDLVFIHLNLFIIHSFSYFLYHRKKMRFLVAYIECTPPQCLLHKKNQAFSCTVSILF